MMRHLDHPCPSDRCDDACPQPACAAPNLIRFTPPVQENNETKKMKPMCGRGRAGGVAEFCRFHSFAVMHLFIVCVFTSLASAIAVAPVPATATTLKLHAKELKDILTEAIHE